MTVEDASTADTTAAPADLRRCWGCRTVWPREAMQWGTQPAGPAWHARPVRVLRCPDCRV
jgi:hypothetical protein